MCATEMKFVYELSVESDPARNPLPSERQSRHRPPPPPPSFLSPFPLRCLLGKHLETY